MVFINIGNISLITDILFRIINIKAFTNIFNIIFFIYIFFLLKDIFIIFHFFLF